MDSLRDGLFRREEDEVIVEDKANTPTEEGASPEGERHRSWKERQKHLKAIS
jgi:hypothetical protein